MPGVGWPWVNLSHGDSVRYLCAGSGHFTSCRQRKRSFTVLASPTVTLPGKRIPIKSALRALAQQPFVEGDDATLHGFRQIGDVTNAMLSCGL